MSHAIVLTLALIGANARAQTLSNLPFLESVGGLRWGMSISEIQRAGAHNCKFVSASLAGSVAKPGSDNNDSLWLVCESKLFPGSPFSLLFDLADRKLNKITMIMAFNYKYLENAFGAEAPGTLHSEILRRSTEQISIAGSYAKQAPKDLSKRMKFISFDAFQTRISSAMPISPGDISRHFEHEFKELKVQSDARATYEWKQDAPNVKGITLYTVAPDKGSYVMIFYSPLDV